MSKIYIDGEYVVLTDELKKQLNMFDIIEENNVEKSGTDTVTALAEGLSTATTLAQVRSAAKSVLGGDADE